MKKTLISSLCILTLGVESYATNVMRVVENDGNIVEFNVDNVKYVDYYNSASTSTITTITADSSDRYLISNNKLGITNIPMTICSVEKSSSVLMEIETAEELLNKAKVDYDIARFEYNDFKQRFEIIKEIYKETAAEYIDAQMVLKELEDHYMKSNTNYNEAELNYEKALALKDRAITLIISNDTIIVDSSIDEKSYVIYQDFKDKFVSVSAEEAKANPSKILFICKEDSVLASGTETNIDIIKTKAGKTTFVKENKSE